MQIAIYKQATFYKISMKKIILNKGLKNMHMNTEAFVNNLVKELDKNQKQHNIMFTVLLL